MRDDSKAIKRMERYVKSWQKVAELQDQTWKGQAPVIYCEKLRQAELQVSSSIAKVALLVDTSLM